MRDIFDYLKKLKNSDLNEIQKYLESTFFKVKSRTNVIQLYKILKKHHPQYKNITDDFLAEKLNIQIATLRNLKTFLTDSIEEYLELKIFRQNKTLKTQLRAQAYDELNMHQHFIKYADKELEKLERKQNFDQQDYILKYELLIRKYAIIPHNIVDVKNVALIEAINTLSNYYLYECLKNLNGIITANRMVDRETKILFTQLIANSTDTIEHIEDINIKVSYLLYKYYILNNNQLNKKEQIYTALKEIVWENWGKLTDDCKYETYQHMVNIANDIRVTYGFEKFVDEPFIIHKFWIEKKAHQIHAEMNYHLFLSAVISSCNANKVDWCKKFISTNKLMLPISERTSIVDFSLAYYYFSIGQIDDAILKLHNIQMLGVYFNLVVRILMLRCLFVAKYDDRFINFHNHTFNFINNHNELNDTAKKEHLTFINYLKGLQNARSNNNIKKINNIKTKIQTAKNAQISNWLLQQIDMLLNKGF